MRVALTTLCLSAPAALAGADTPTLPDFADRAEAFYQSIDGSEVTVSGWIGRFINPDPLMVFFQAETGDIYHVPRLEARERRRDLKDCQLARFGEPQDEGNCRAEGIAVIKVDDNWNDSFPGGYRIYLSILNLEIQRQ